MDEMSQMPLAVSIKEEDGFNIESEVENRGEPVESIIKKEELLLDHERQQMAFCGGSSIKEEDDGGEERIMEMASVLIAEQEDDNFENEGGTLQEDVLKIKKGRQRPCPRSRKRKQSETEGNKSLPLLGKRRNLRSQRKTRSATSSQSRLAEETSGAEHDQVFAPPQGRPIPQTYRDTEVSEPDNLLRCDECAGDYEGDCPEHGPMNIIEDVVVPADISDQSRATRTAPPQVRIGNSKIPGAGCGIRARETIPARTRFGPYEGIIIPVEECTSYSWLIRKDGVPGHCIDATEPGLSNWMRFVNCARNESERNLVAFQYLGQLYYRTVCPVDPDEELLVWCGKDYGVQLGIHLESSDVVTAKNIKESAKESSHHSDELDETITSSVFISNTEIEVEYIDENELASISTADESPFVCNQCNEYCFDEETLTSHLLTHAGENPFVCNLCNERFFDRRTLTKHQGGHGSQVMAKYVCAECFESFPSKLEFTKHERKHSREKPFLCLKCNKRFAQSEELKGHLQFHDGEKPFGCNQCNKRFHLQVQLQKHLTAHIQEKPPFVCPGCQKHFSQKFNLEQHLLTHSECSKRAIACLLCGNKCSDEGELHTHMETEHNGDRPFECVTCSERFYDKASLSRHERSHAGEQPYHCGPCDERFSRKLDYQRHKKKTHRHEEPCENCNQQFLIAEEFDRHLSTCKSRDNYSCPVCKKQYPSRAYLRFHLSLHSTEREAAVCRTCKQVYSSTEALQRHMQLHSDGPRFSCRDCFRGFEKKAELKEHVLIHSNEKRLVCSVCKTRFKFRTSFATHLRTHGLEYHELSNEDVQQLSLPD